MQKLAGHSGILQNTELTVCTCFKFSFRKSFEYYYSRDYGKSLEELKLGNHL